MDPHKHTFKSISGLFGSPYYHRPKADCKLLMTALLLIILVS